MIESKNRLQEALELPVIYRVRRNHGLEHATLHVLSGHHPGLPLAGHSDAGGYWILGELQTEEVANAAREALARLLAGEAKLAIHPNCGTNFAAAGIFAGLAAGLAMFGVGRKLRDNFERLPTAVMFATLALIFAQPLGLALQEHVTTSGKPGDLHVLEVQQRKQGKLTIHRVVTGG